MVDRNEERKTYNLSKFPFHWTKEELKKVINSNSYNVKVQNPVLDKLLEDYYLMERGVESGDGSFAGRLEYKKNVIPKWQEREMKNNGLSEAEFEKKLRDAKIGSYVPGEIGELIVAYCTAEHLKAGRKNSKDQDPIAAERRAEEAFVDLLESCSNPFLKVLLNSDQGYQNFRIQSRFIESFTKQVSYLVDVIESCTLEKRPYAMEYALRSIQKVILDLQANYAGSIYEKRSNDVQEEDGQLSIEGITRRIYDGLVENREWIQRIDGLGEFDYSPEEYTHIRDCLSKPIVSEMKRNLAREEYLDYLVKRKFGKRKAFQGYTLYAVQEIEKGYHWENFDPTNGTSQMNRILSIIKEHDTELKEQTKNSIKNELLYQSIKYENLVAAEKMKAIETILTGYIKIFDDWDVSCDRLECRFVVPKANGLSVEKFSYVDQLFQFSYDRLKQLIIEANSLVYDVLLGVRLGCCKASIAAIRRLHLPSEQNKVITESKEYKELASALESRKTMYIRQAFGEFIKIYKKALFDRARIILLEDFLYLQKANSVRVESHASRIRSKDYQKEGAWRENEKSEYNKSFSQDFSKALYAAMQGYRKRDKLKKE